MTRVLWDERRIQELKRLAAVGYSASQISKKMGDLTRNAVCAFASRKKIKLYGNIKFAKKIKKVV